MGTIIGILSILAGIYFMREIASWFFGLIGKAWANVEDAFGVILWLVFIVIGLNWLIG